MFSLIISIIAIALVIVLAGASLYYGGEAFNQGTAKGEFAKIVNEGQQVSAALTLMSVEGVDLTDANSDSSLTVADIPVRYLNATPTNTFVIDEAAGTLTLSGVSDDVCAAFLDANDAQVNPLASCDTATGTAVYTL